MFRLLANVSSILAITLLLASTGHGAGGVSCERWLDERAAGDWFERGQWIRGAAIDPPVSGLELLDRVDGMCTLEPTSTLASVLGQVAR